MNFATHKKHKTSLTQVMIKRCKKLKLKSKNGSLGGSETSKTEFFYLELTELKIEMRLQTFEVICMNTASSFEIKTKNNEKVDGIEKILNLEKQTRF